MSERDDYLAYVGEVAGEAQETVLNEMCDAIISTIKELEPLLDEESYLIVKEKFKKDFPLSF